MSILSAFSIFTSNLQAQHLSFLGCDEGTCYSLAYNIPDSAGQLAVGYLNKTTGEDGGLYSLNRLKWQGGQGNWRLIGYARQDSDLGIVDSIQVDLVFTSCLYPWSAKIQYRPEDPLFKSRYALKGDNLSSQIIVERDGAGRLPI